MSKKSRRARAKARSVEPVAGVSQAPSRPQPKMQTAPQSSTRQPMSPAMPAAALQPRNYDYVKADMVRVAIIAGSLILILIILAFIPGLRS